MHMRVLKNWVDNLHNCERERVFGWNFVGARTNTHAVLPFGRQAAVLLMLVKLSFPLSKSTEPNCAAEPAAIISLQ